jgi:spermidine synthase
MHRDLARYAHGNVLIGGLGLGILPRMLMNRKNVKSITVVESNPDVIGLVRSYVYRDFTDRSRINIIQADIHDYVRDLKPDVYDSALLDTWQDTGEWVWQTEVVPLKRTIAGKIPRIY